MTKDLRFDAVEHPIFPKFILHIRHIETDRAIARYATYGSCVAEVEVDILTGETQVIRTDIVLDVGERLVDPRVKTMEPRVRPPHK